MHWCVDARVHARSPGTRDHPVQALLRKGFGCSGCPEHRLSDPERAAISDGAGIKTMPRVLPAARPIGTGRCISKARSAGHLPTRAACSRPKGRHARGRPPAFDPWRRRRSKYSAFSPAPSPCGRSQPRKTPQPIAAPFRHFSGTRRGGPQRGLAKGRGRPANQGRPQASRLKISAEDLATSE